MFNEAGKPRATEVSCEAKVTKNPMEKTRPYIKHEAATKLDTQKTMLRRNKGEARKMEISRQNASNGPRFPLTFARIRTYV